jgi:hypothetical protein
MTALIEIQGVGESLANRMIDALGSEAEVLRALNECDVAALSEVDGLSAQRAVKMINSANGRFGEISSSDEARRLHAQILETISPYISSKPAKSRLGTLVPLQRSDITTIESRRLWTKAALDFTAASSESAENWQNFATKFERVKPVKGKIDRVVVVPNTKSLEKIENISKRCRIIVRGVGETWRDYHGLNRVTWIGRGAPESLPAGWIVAKESDHTHTILPEIPLKWLENNISSLSALSSLSDYEWPNGTIGEAIREALDGLESLPLLIDSIENESMKIEELQHIKDGLWGEIRNIEAAIDDIIVAGTAQSSLSLEGSEVLSFYGDIHGLERRVKSAVADTIEEALTAGRSRLCEYFKGSEIIIPRELFESEYPCQINRNIVEQIEEKIDGMISSENSQAEIEQSRTIQKIISNAQKSISQCIEIDMWIGIGQWAQQYKCTLPKLDARRPGICMRDGRHILLDVKPDPVTYGIGGPADSKNNQNLALLTGANSGGKTTLIETIAIITLLAHSGLAVPALSAKVGLLDEIHLLAKVTGTQSAGALERTLIRLAEVFISEKRKLVLADELEAITEPEAAARILGGLLAASNNNSETAVLLVTHIGRSIEAAIGIDVRIDGIEARGLDENLELIVDRTPRRNHIAKSTPELIVRRLAARASGNTANLFENLLKSFS